LVSGLFCDLDLTASFGNAEREKKRVVETKVLDYLMEDYDIKDAA